MFSSLNFILHVSLRRTHSKRCVNIAFCMREIQEKCFWSIIFGTGRYLLCYNQDNCRKIMIFVSMLFPKRSAWCLRFASIFFSWKKEASNKPVETINVKLLNVAVSSRLPSLIASSVLLIPEVRNCTSPQMIPGPQMIPDRKWSRTANDPHIGPQMIPIKK